MKQLTYEKDGKYYLTANGDGPDTEINKWQFDSIGKLTAEPVSGDLSEAAILRLHQESDPASPLYKGSEPADGGEPFGDLPIEEPTQPGYYDEPFRSAPAEVSPETTGISVHTTDEATKANAGVTSEELAKEEFTKSLQDTTPETIDAATEANKPANKKK